MSWWPNIFTPKQSRKLKFFNSFSLRSNFLSRLNTSARVYSPLPTQESPIPTLFDGCYDSDTNNNHDNNNDSYSDVILSKCWHTISLQWVSIETKRMALAWICMMLAILSGSSIGPVFKYMEINGVTPLLAASWRSQCMSIWLFPFTIIEIVRSDPAERSSWFDTKADLKFPVGVHVLIAGILWSVSLLSWIVAIQYTSTGWYHFFPVHPIKFAYAFTIDYSVFHIFPKPQFLVLSSHM